jgi:hypothetical protein
MKTLATKMHGEFPVSLISNSSENRFNISMNCNLNGEIVTLYHFPTMVKENKAREAYETYK